MCQMHSKVVGKRLNENINEIYCGDTLLSSVYFVTIIVVTTACNCVNLIAYYRVCEGGNSRWSTVPQVNQDILDFITNDCDFDCEHADGSFLDHLQFCYEYCHSHFPGSSPLVLFLHSIMGVGTNLFPMLLEQRPKLASLLTEHEMLHVESFPSVLRLLQTDLLPHLLNLSKKELATIDGIKFHRLIGPNMRELMHSDNAALFLGEQDFWTHLNYHLIHFLDFLPAHKWEEKMHSGLFPNMIFLHMLLQRAGGFFFIT